MGPTRKCSQSILTVRFAGHNLVGMFTLIQFQFLIKFANFCAEARPTKRNNKKDIKRERNVITIHSESTKKKKEKEKEVINN